MTGPDNAQTDPASAAQPAAASPILIEQGEDASVLVIAFTGFQGGLTMPTFDFLALTKLTRYSRILLLDTSRTCYLGGIPPLLEDYGALLAHLRQKISELEPRRILCVGASSGAFGALLLGHELGADYVHAFSPYTYLDRASVERYQDPDGAGNQAEAFTRIHGLPADLRRLFDLQTVLARHNGKTRYFIHACRNSRWDMLRAKHLKACPGVMVIGFPCAGHGVASTLARNGLLGGLLKLENQAQMGRRIREAISRSR